MTAVDLVPIDRNGHMLYATQDQMEQLIAAVGGSAHTPNSGPVARPLDTNAYANGDLIANSTVAGSVVVPTVVLANSGTGKINRLRLHTNKTPTPQSWDGTVLRIGLWSTPPTYINGDNATYSIATGAAGFLGTMDVTFTQYGDGATAIGVPATPILVENVPTLYWDLMMVKNPHTPASGQTFDLTVEQS